MSDEKITIPCAVYDDLLPLVCDGLASEESRVLVEEHRKTCPHCNKKQEKEVIEMEIENEIRILEKIKLQLLAWAFVPLLLGIFYGLSIARNENMFQNIWIMPLLGGLSAMRYSIKSLILLFIVASISFLTHFMPVFFSTENIVEVYGSWGHYIWIYVQNGFWWARIYAGLFFLGQVIGGTVRYLRKKKNVDHDSQEVLNKNRKTLMKYVCIFLSTGLTIGILWFANGLNGNPISKYLATKSAETYLSQTYGDTDFILENVHYNFKTGGYYARISSPSSIDSHFTLDMSLSGELQRDYYESDVLDGYNTFMRCDEGYRDLVNPLFSDPDFPFSSDLGYGSFLSSDEMYKKMKDSLVLDQEFDYEVLGKEFGELSFYAKDEEITLEKVSEILLELKDFFDGKQVYFHQIYFVLEEPYIDGQRNFDGETLRIHNFLYEDIYEEGLLERVAKAYEETKVYMEEENEKTANLFPENIDT